MKKAILIAVILLTGIHQSCKKENSTSSNSNNNSSANKKGDIKATIHADIPSSDQDYTYVPKNKIEIDLYKGSFGNGSYPINIIYAVSDATVDFGEYDYADYDIRGYVQFNQIDNSTGKVVSTGHCDGHLDFKLDAASKNVSITIPR